MSPEQIDIDTLIARYDTLLLDAYGVLVDQSGPLPGAVALLERLNRERHPFLLLTNSASRLPETMASDFTRSGLTIPAGRIISSGMLLEPLFAQRGLYGARCLVLGPEEAREYVRRAGGEVIPPGAGADAEVVIVADQKGFELQQGLDETISLLLRRFDRGDTTTLLLCNPDLIYPVSGVRYGFTSGALAAMLDRILAERYPGNAPCFEPLGKPHRPIFEAAAKLADGNMVMLGDQLPTDILGAQQFGIDAVLVMSGLTRRFDPDADIIPDYLLPSLQA
jgi:HAD superfamily hydrolase (TIGR01450 family)